MISLSQASWTQDRPYFYRFKMCLGRRISYVTDTYKHIKDSSSHEPWALWYFEGLKNKIEETWEKLQAIATARKAEAAEEAERTKKLREDKSAAAPT